MWAWGMLPAGVLQPKAGKAFFVNFLTDVSPACDGLPYHDQALAKDIGILNADTE